ncbi:hypothetical protein A0J61_10611 [Choanephora cucurbitarum]|uniref:Endonuclease/exonuclease/phosphatase domain-containing protein n=1 Tax=Choanephora cucurbitarum TaxID=101091 RepID=A0A1C7N158_9FUNG|nr:hypothetical protein A0J61_10857 [Choanephora cucurbitarum]OBZ81340.1 hypothetical protein A0J61_10611 [Choanephora cucurbitarum]
MYRTWKTCLLHILDVSHAKIRLCMVPKYTSVLDVRCAHLDVHQTHPVCRGVRYIRTLSLDIIALQETYAVSTDLASQFHMQFQAVDSIWTPHCGLVPFSPDLFFSQIVKSPCGRLITAIVSHKSDLFEPLSVSVLYAPVCCKERYPFLQDLIHSLPSSPILQAQPLRHILLGDFNYSISSGINVRFRRSKAPTSWLNHVDRFYADAVTPRKQAAHATFSGGLSQSCIDYSYVSKDLYPARTYGSVFYINPAWTDHFMVKTCLQLVPSSVSNSLNQTGKGLWRAHPGLAKDPVFCEQLASALSQTVASFPDWYYPTLQWESLKTTTRSVAQLYSRKKAFSLKKAEQTLQVKRRILLKLIDHHPDRTKDVSSHLRVIEGKLQQLQ